MGLPCFYNRTWVDLSELMGSRRLEGEEEKETGIRMVWLKRV